MRGRNHALPARRVERAKGSRGAAASRERIELRNAHADRIRGRASHDDSLHDVGNVGSAGITREHEARDVG